MTDLLTDTSPVIPETSDGVEPSISLGRALKRHWLPALLVFATIAAAISYRSLRQPPIYQSQIKILLEDIAEVPPIDPLTPITQRQRNSRSNEIQVLTSTAIIDEASRLLPAEYQNLGAGAILSQLRVQLIPDTDVLAITYTAGDPEQVKAVLDALGETYISFSLTSRQSQVRNAIDFINEQLPLARQTFEITEAEIQQFQEANRIIDPSIYAQSLTEILQTYEQRLTEAEIRLNELDRQEQVLQAQLQELGQIPDDAPQDLILSRNQGYLQLRQRLQDLTLELVEQQVHYREDSPVIQQIVRQRNDVLILLEQQISQVLGSTAPITLSAEPPETGSLPLLVDQPFTTLPAVTPGLDQGPNSTTDGELPDDTDSLVESLIGQYLQNQTEQAIQETSRGTIQQALNTINQEFDTLPQLRRIYLQLERQNQAAYQVVQDLETRLQELQISDAQEDPPWSLIEIAKLPEQSIAQDPRVNITLGILAGIAAGVGAAYLLESLDSRVKSLDEAKELTKVPLLGSIPQLRVKEVVKQVSLNGAMTPSNSQRSQKARSKKRSSSARVAYFKESFRSIALNLRYIPSDQGKALIVTSSTSQEGKSTITYYLGASLAQLDYKVLIVDADMRRPTQHEFFDDVNAVGLSTLFMSKQAWADLVVNTSINNLKILPSGPIPPDPGALLSSQQVTHLVNEWKQAFDYVLIDTPPVLGIADVEGIEADVEGIILVAGLRRVHRAGVSRTCEILRRGKHKLVGMIVNRDETGSGGYYGYGYGYGYHT